MDLETMDLNTIKEVEEDDTEVAVEVEDVEDEEDSQAHSIEEITTEQGLAPSVSSEKESTNKKRNIIVGTVLGLVIFIAVVLGITLSDSGGNSSTSLLDGTGEGSSTEDSSPANKPANATLETLPESFANISQQLAEQAERSTYLVAEIVDGECQTIFGANADVVTPIASVVNLYVLGALARAIVLGDAAWTDELAVQEGLKSVAGPRGRLQRVQAGTKFSLLEYAQFMIQLSDNTATDHLIDFLGRDAVENVQIDLGHHNANLNIPFLTTADLVRLKHGISDTAVAEYLSLHPEGRRKFLDNLSSIPLGNIGSVSPRLIDEIEWFATPNDLCRLFEKLDVLAAYAGEEEMQSIMEYAGSGLYGGNWTYVGFKGGAEAGVLTRAFVADRSDGRRFVQVLSLTDTTKLVNGQTASLLAAEGFRLLALV